MIILNSKNFKSNSLNNSLNVYNSTNRFIGLECPYCKLQEMRMLEHKGKGYEPEYERTDLTDYLHRFLGINTDNEIVTYKKIKKILDEQEK